MRPALQQGLLCRNKNGSLRSRLRSIWISAPSWRGLDLLEEVGLSAFALQFFTGTADRLELGVVHGKKRTIYIAANLAFASVDEAVEGVLKDVSGHLVIPFA